VAAALLREPARVVPSPPATVARSQSAWGESRDQENCEP